MSTASRRTPAANSLAPSAVKSPVLSALARIVARHRAAIIARDPAEIGKISETLAMLLNELAESLSDDQDGWRDAEVLALAKHVREEMAINQALLRTGLAAIDHYMMAFADAAPADGITLFSGTA